MYNKIIYYIDKVDRLERGEIVAPVTCEIDPTNECQNSCYYCISKRRNKAEMDWEFYIKLIGQLKDAGVKSIVFVGGGEPTLHPKFNDMAKTAYEAQFKLGLITNGILLNTVLVEMFEYIRIGLDAGSPETYYKIKATDYFDIVISNIRAVGPRCKTLGINYIIAGQEAGDIDRTAELAEELKVDYIHFKPALGMDGARQYGKMRFFSTWPPTLKYPKSFYTKQGSPHKKGCMIAALVGIVTADGRYAYCCLHRYDEGFTVANLHKENLEAAIAKRAAMTVDISSCSACRYHGYYEAYLEAKKPENIYDQHMEFL